MNTSLRDVFARTKPVIAMAHFPPLPGAPRYDERAGMQGILDSIVHDVSALQQGGVDAVMFGNEGDRPYLTRVGPETVAAMAAVIGCVKSQLRVPFGVDILWDPVAAIGLAKGTGACFVREVLTSVYASDMGLWDTDCGATLRYRRAIDAQDVDLLFNVNAEFACSLDGRSIASIAHSVVFSSLADILCVSGPTTGQPADESQVAAVKRAVPEAKVLANTGVTAANVGRIMAIADGVVVGTSLKKDGVTWNKVDPERVKRFMDSVNSCR